MAIIRSSGYRLKDSGDDESFQMLIGDMQRIRQRAATLEKYVATLRSSPNLPFWGFKTSASAQNIATNALQVITWVSPSGVENLFDTTGGSLDTTGVNVPNAGYYRAFFSGVIDQTFSASSTYTQGYATLAINGTADYLSRSEPYLLVTPAAITQMKMPLSFSCLVRLVAGDRVSVMWGASLAAGETSSGTATWSFERVHQH